MKGTRPVREYVYRGEVERFRSSSRGYVWFRGYSATGNDGCALQPWMTWTECQAEAKRDGVMARFVRPK